MLQLPAKSSEDVSDTLAYRPYCCACFALARCVRGVDGFGANAASQSALPSTLLPGYTIRGCVSCIVEEWQYDVLGARASSWSFSVVIAPTRRMEEVA